LAEFGTGDKARLMAVFQENLGKPVPECLHSGFYITGAKDEEGDGDSWSYKRCKAAVKLSPPTYQHPTFYRPDALPVAQPTVSEH